MLTPDQALGKILARARPLAAERVSVQEAGGRVLACDVRAADDLPRFDNSAMDGFAVRAADIHRASRTHPVALRLTGEVQAGSSPRKKLMPGCAIRISTGAPVPAGADAVIMQEECDVRGSRVLVRGTEPKGGNIRFRGEEIRKGRVALRRGVRLTPGTLAWLATMGVRNITVIRRPRVGLLRSGNEVVEISKSPQRTQVRDAHGLSLKLALREMGLVLDVAPIVRDRPAATRRAFAGLLGRCDVVLTTGGVSVGRHDLLMEAAQAIGLRPVFHKIAQKPGKPMVFGAKGRKLWFGLPGNPVSSLFCFYYYVRPALLKRMGRDDFLPVWWEGFASTPVRRSPKRTEFMRGRLRGKRVEFAVKQGSHCLGSFADSNVLVRIDSSLSGRRVRCIRI
jgi:molybdopterin molybdotransferase